MTLEKKAFIIPIFGIFYQKDTHKKKVPDRVATMFSKFARVK